MTLQGFSSRSKQGLYRSLQAFGISTSSPTGFTPICLCVYDDKVYVADYFENRIIVFSKTGTYITEFGTTGNGNGEFTNPEYITTNGLHLFVLDSTRIIKHQFDGTFVASILKPASSIKLMVDVVDGVAVSYSKTVVSDREYVKTYDYNFSPLRECYYVKPFGSKTSYLTYIDGKNLLHTTGILAGKFHLFSGGISGDIGVTNATNPNYLDNVKAETFKTQIANNGSIIYSLITPTVFNVNLQNFDSTSPPYTQTLIGAIDGDGDLGITSLFYYDGEIYGTNPDFTDPLDSLIRVYSISDGSTIREWTL